MSPCSACAGRRAQRFRIDDISVGSRTRVGGDLVDQVLAQHFVGSAPPSLSGDDRENLIHEVRLMVEKFKKTWGSQYEQALEGAGFRFPAPKPAATPAEGLCVPSIARVRVGVAATEREVSPDQWARMARDLAILPNDKTLRQNVRALSQTSSLAVNRLQLAESLLPCSRRVPLPAPRDHPMRCSVALNVVRAILRNVASDDPRGRKIESLLQTYVRAQFATVARRTGMLNRTLVQEMAETPGKLLWSTGTHTCARPTPAAGTRASRRPSSTRWPSAEPPRATSTSWKTCS